MPRLEGFYWHVHHNKLLEWCYNYDERADIIRNHRPESEQAIRLRLFQPVKGQLPKKVVKAGQIFDQAWQTLDQGWQAYIQAGQALVRADEEAYYQARRVYDKAIANNKEVIEQLHAIECPNCPWNGHTIFPN